MNLEHILKLVEEAKAAAEWDAGDRFKRLAASLQAAQLKEEITEAWRSMEIPPPTQEWRIETGYGALTYILDVDANTFRDAAPFIAGIRGLGWKREEGDPAVVGGTHVWKFTRFHQRRQASEVLELRLSYARAEGPDACHLEQVGTETREVPIYKLVCPGAEAAPAPIEEAKPSEEAKDGDSEEA